MGLRELAEADLAVTLEDAATGFAFAISVTDPAGTVAPLNGQSNDVGQAIDVETGQIVSGRIASVVLRLSSIAAAGLVGIPQGIQDGTSKPWIIRFDDINGNAFDFKVAESFPDRALGVVACRLENWTD